jgi:hypothetical protein
MTVNDPRTGANIACRECGARPFPELGPSGTRQTFQLHNGPDGWRCEQHPAARAPAKKESASSLEQIKTLLSELAGKVANLDADIVEDVFGKDVAEVDETEQGEALELIDRIQTAVTKLRRRT